MTNLEPIVFTRGVPATESFPLDEMVAATERALRKSGDKTLQYGPSWGYLPLREWLAAWHTTAVGNILISNGSLQIVEFLCSAIISPGDVVFVEEPTYDRTLTTLRKHGAQPVGIPLEADGPNIAALEAALETHTPRFFYIIPDFQNPAGATCSPAKRERLVELARRHNFFYLEDAPYRRLRYRGDAAPSLFEMAPDVVMHMSSFSKLIGPGPRMGYILSHDADLMKQLARIAEDTYISPNYFAHGAIYEFVAAGHLDPQIEKLKALYAPRLDATLAALARYLPDTEATRPDGGFFLSVTFPEGVSTDVVREKAAAYNLTLADGKAFFVTGGDRFLRIPFCAITPATIDEGIRRLAQAVNDARA